MKTNTFTTKMAMKANTFPTKMATFHFHKGQPSLIIQKWLKWIRM